MNKPDHLSLRMARLKPSEEMLQNEEGLTFIFSKGGVGKYTSKMGTQRLGLGDILVVNGVAGGKFSVFDKGEFTFWSFTLSFEHLLPLFASAEITRLHHVTDGFKAAKIYPASSPLAGDCQKLLAVVPPQFDLDHRGQLIRIAATILSLEFKATNAHRAGFARPEDHMVQVFEKLSASELINLSVGELAGRFNCSRRHLNRLFHQHFGVSVASLRMEMRLLKAVSLLRDPSAKVINVAEQCGFNHLGLFNTCFKRRFGSSPGQWRKNAQQGETVPIPAAEARIVCPLHVNGTCPMGGSMAAAHPAIMTTLSGKVTGGSNILDNLKSQGLMFGAQATASLNLKRSASKASAETP